MMTCFCIHILGEKAGWLLNTVVTPAVFDEVLTCNAKNAVIPVNTALALWTTICRNGAEWTNSVEVAAACLYPSTVTVPTAPTGNIL